MITFTIIVREITPGHVPVICTAIGEATQAESDIAMKLLAAIKEHATTQLKAAGGGKMFERNFSGPRGGGRARHE